MLVMLLDPEAQQAIDPSVIRHRWQIWQIFGIIKTEAIPIIDMDQFY